MFELRSKETQTDTQAVLMALTEVLVEHLAEGKIVNMGDFEAFQVSISSDGAETLCAIPANSSETEP